MSGEQGVGFLSAGVMLYMNRLIVHRNRTTSLQIPYPSSSTGIFPQDFPEDVSTDEDDDEFSRGRRKKKTVKPWEKNNLEKIKGKARLTFGRETICSHLCNLAKYQM